MIASEDTAHRPPYQPAPCRRNEDARVKSLGFTLIEVTLVFLVSIFLIVLGIPRIQATLIENRSPSISRDLIKIAARVIASRVSEQSAPYTGFNTASLTTFSADTGLIIRSPTAMSHPLTRADQAAASVTAAPAAGGSAFVITLSAVDTSGCGPLVTSLGDKSDWISVNGAVVRDAQASPPVDLLPGTVAVQCGGDSNVVAVQFR